MTISVLFGSYNSKHIAHITQHPPRRQLFNPLGGSTTKALRELLQTPRAGACRNPSICHPNKKKPIHTYNHVHTYSRVVRRRNRSLADKRLNQEAFGGGRRQYRSKQADSHAGGCPIEEKSFTIIFGNWTTTSILKRLSGFSDGNGGKTKWLAATWSLLRGVVHARNPWWHGWSPLHSNVA